MTKLSVLLIYGGESSEHDVSIKSAYNVYAALDNDKYHVTLCYIDRRGKWWLTKSIDGSHIGQPQLFPALGQKQFLVIPGNTLVHIDVVLPILHGRFGEDGTLQGLCELMHIPYVGPSILGAAVTMDKDMTKRLLRDAGIPVVPWLVWQTHAKAPSYAAAAEQLGDTLFVKPSRAGSSVGVTKVSSARMWQEALETAASHDSMVLIERAIDGREIELAVLGNHRPKVTIPGEIVPGEEFYSYDDKYDAASTSSVQIPAELSAVTIDQLQDYARRAYEVVADTGMARVDFFVTKNKIFLNEINSIPGFTNISMYPKLWHHEGLKYPQLIDKLISLALEK